MLYKDLIFIDKDISVAKTMPSIFYKDKKTKLPKLISGLKPETKNTLDKFFRKP